MVSPEHVDEQKPEDKQMPSSAEKKQAPIVVEKKRLWNTPLMRVLGVLVSLIGGIASLCLAIVGFSYPTPQYPTLSGLVFVAFLLAFIVGVGGAMLFRSWWAILVVPIVLTLGALLAAYLIPILFSPNPYDADDVGLGVVYSMIIIPICAIIGALIGSYFGTLWKKRQQE